MLRGGRQEKHAHASKAPSKCSYPIGVYQPSMRGRIVALTQAMMCGYLHACRGRPNDSEQHGKANVKRIHQEVGLE